MAIGIRRTFLQSAALSKTNNTLAVVPGLTFELAPNSVYQIDAQVFVTAGATPGQKTALVGQDTGVIETSVERGAAAAYACSQAQSFDGGAAAITGIVRYRGVIRNITAAAVVFSIQAAQSVTDVAAVTFEDGFLNVTQI